MADTVSKIRRSEIMSSVKAADTKPELIVRQYLFRNGFRYRLHNKKLPGKPDIVLKKYKTVILVNGCFWHGHENCKIYVMPKSNVKFWEDKIENNKRRDANNILTLETLGWEVLIVWECELKASNRELTLQTILNKLKNNNNEIQRS